MFFCFLVFIPINAYATTVQIDTSEGPTPLVVPDTYDQLKQSYITMAKLYVEERYAHKKSLAQVDQLLKDVADLKTVNGNLIGQIAKLNTQITDLTKQVNHVKLLQFGVDGFYQTNLVNLTPSVGIGVRAEILQKFGVRLDYSPLTSIQIGFDWKF